MGEDTGAGQQGQEAGRALEDEDDRQRPPERGHWLILASHWSASLNIWSLIITNSEGLTLMEIRSRYQYQCCGALTH